MNRAAAAVRAYQNGTNFQDELKTVEAFGQRTAEANPGSTMGGEIAGGVVGTAPLIAAAPVAFGAGAAPVAMRVGAGLASGGILGGADAAVRGGDFDQTTRAAAIGAGVGVLGPALGPAVGQGVRALDRFASARGIPVPGLGVRAAAALADDVRSSGGVPAVQDRLAQLGPDAMLLDASPSLEGRAQGLAVLPQTRDAVMTPLAERARGANARLTTDVNAAVGPAADPALFHSAMDAGYARDVPQLYQQALAQPVTVDTSPVLASIGRLAEQEKGGAATALNRAWGLLHTEAEVPGVGRAMVPDRRPEALHNAKEALDAMIATVQNQQGSAAGSELRALSAVRAGVNDALEAQVPGYAQANRTAQGYFQRREMFDRGQTLLNGGRDSIRPAQLAAETAAMEPTVASAQRLGTRAEIDRLVGTTVNDRVALSKAVQGEGDWNRARLGTVFGEEPTQRIVGAVERERTFDASKTRINDNAMTELRKRSADATAPREISPSGGGSGFSLAAVLGGPQAAAGAAAARGAKMAGNAVVRASDITRNQQLARLLTAPESAERTATIQAIASRLAVEARSSGDAARIDAMARALMASQGERGRRLLPQ